MANPVRSRARLNIANHHLVAFLASSIRTTLNIGHAKMPMKFRCLSDTHGEVPEGSGDSAETAWLHAGDLCNQGVVSPEFSEQLEIWHRKMHIPVYAVRGNHDCWSAAKCLAAATSDVSGKTVRIAPNLFLAGVGWSGIAYYDLPSEANLQTVCEKVLKSARSQMAPGDRCLLLTHYPAKIPIYKFDGDSDVGFLFNCVAALIEALKPLAVIQGHVHGFFYTDAIYKVGEQNILIVNPGPEGGTLTLDPADWKATYRHWINEAD